MDVSHRGNLRTMVWGCKAEGMQCMWRKGVLKDTKAMRPWGKLAVKYNVHVNMAKKSMFFSYFGPLFNTYLFSSRIFLINIKEIKSNTNMKIITD